MEQEGNMSYDISFKVKVEGANRYVEVGNCDANITWNVRKIIELSTGLPWKNEANNGLVKDIIPRIEKGLLELRSNPEKYKSYEAPNGWGTVDGAKYFFRQILKAWECFIRDHEELADVVTFWIE
jgi:hypothetical protein